ncbi:MAG TPA: rhomboid family intramembrane serine protease [Anaerolineales bacterium]|nr:rhomboid family intramembrane serine protease [Anaerolineales bacterium]
MIPLRDSNRSSSFPVMTWLLIAANTLVFIYELGLSGGQLERFVGAYALVPARIKAAPLTYGFTIFSSIFMHAGWFHLISNMWVLFIFGDNVEDRMGSLAYLIFYLLSGAAAGALQTYLTPGSSVPVLGASGAIAGVLGAYIFLFPRARVVTLVPIFFFMSVIEIPALFFLGFWFISQLFAGLASIGAEAAQGVAWWAHIGGFLVGLVVSTIFLKRLR